MFVVKAYLLSMSLVDTSLTWSSDARCLLGGVQQDGALAHPHHEGAPSCSFAACL